MTRLRWLFTAIAALVVLRAAMCVVVQPELDRNWAADQSRLPLAEFSGNRVTIRNIRNLEYRSESDYTPAWYDKTFDLEKLESAWFVVEPFGKGGAAHTFVSFGFGGNDFVAISVEIRKEEGESFSVLKGLNRQYELMYVIGDERDLIRLRTNHRKDVVYLYPIDTTRAKMRKMFTAMLARANKLAAEPEFYNTATNHLHDEPRAPRERHRRGARPVQHRHAAPRELRPPRLRSRTHPNGAAVPRGTATIPDQPAGGKVRRRSAVFIADSRLVVWSAATPVAAVPAFGVK
ncbi:MAG TPA: DUF4105 domain-containing protein, partial [Thermoanaerobaculia bacterium]